MGSFAVGQVVSSAFPFSDLTTQKHRPALIVAQADFGDIILCQITSKTYSSTKHIKLSSTDFAEGGLPIDSFIRHDKLFTADTSIVHNVYGKITAKKLQETQNAIRSLFSAE